jgi:GT2 family glycosyltransferase
MADKSIDKVAVVIPNLNGENYIGDAIDSLLKQTLLATIIVVENASTDGSLAILESYGDKIVVLKNEKNLGFAGGVNVGITYALDQDFDAVALLNNDAVATPEWLQELVKAMNQNDSAGIITGQIQLSSGSLLDSTGEFYTTWGMPYPRGREEPVGSYSKAGRYSAPVVVLACTDPPH